MLTPLALRGNARAQAFLGFMYESGYGAPQAYEAAVDLYIEAAMRGNPFGQCMLGLMYDKGHGVGRDVVLAYKWLNLAVPVLRDASAIISCGCATQSPRRCLPRRSARVNALR
jgi:hypothetical protein